MVLGALSLCGVISVLVGFAVVLVEQKSFPVADISVLFVNRFFDISEDFNQYSKNLTDKIHSYQFRGYFAGLCPSSIGFNDSLPDIPEFSGGPVNCSKLPPPGGKNPVALFWFVVANFSGTSAIDNDGQRSFWFQKIISDSLFDFYGYQRLIQLKDLKTAKVSHHNSTTYMQPSKKNCLLENTKLSQQSSQGSNATE